jgi:hypothetical protein
MHEKKRMLLARVLDMEELELKATLLMILDGWAIEEAIELTFNAERRLKSKLKDINA